MSAAALKRLPVLFVVQDNEYAISVPVEEQTPGASISRTVESIPGLHTVEVDGLDVVKSWEAVSKAVAYCRAGNGPALVHAHVIRMRPHSDSDDDTVYRPPQEKEAGAVRDPLVLFEDWLVEKALLGAEDIKKRHHQVRAEVQQAVDSVLDEEEPHGATVGHFVFNPETVTTEETEPAADGAPITMIGAVNRTLEIEMARDERIVVFGEDVADCSRVEHLESVKGKGGVFRATENLQRLFSSHRVFNSQLAEDSIVGRAVGMAVRGLRPVVDPVLRLHLAGDAADPQ